MSWTGPRGRYFDGKTGGRLDVAVELDRAAGRLRLRHADLPSAEQSWPLPLLRRLSDSARSDQVTLALRSDELVDTALVDLPRLTIRDPDLIRAIERACPDLNRRDIARGTAFRIATRLGLAGGALALMLFVILPALAVTFAQIIPPEREAAWGRTVVTQIERLLGGSEIGQLSCRSDAGDAALAQMLARLSTGTVLTYDIEITVLDHKMVNAFAAPGGQVVLMRGLLEKASSPDEIAGVLAHEIGHVEARDVTRNALRAAGSAGLLSMVIGDFTGGTLAILLAEASLSASYTREAEYGADLYALSMLEQANVSSSGFADFFEIIAEMQGDVELPRVFATHPVTSERAVQAETFAQSQSDTSPVLTSAEWADLQAICD